MFSVVRCTVDYLHHFNSLFSVLGYFTAHKQLRNILEQLRTQEMDFTKLGSNNWSEPGKLQEASTTPSKSIASFIQDINQLNIATSMNDSMNAYKSKSKLSTTAAAALQKKNKNISLSASAPVSLFPSLKKSMSNYDRNDMSSPMTGNFGNTIQIGAIC